MGRNMAKNNRNDEEVLEELASDLIKTQEWWKARLVTQLLVAMKPENPVGHATLGYIYLKLNEFEGAETCLRNALDKGGESIQVLLYMATLRSYQGDFSGQLDFATRALKLDDENPMPYFYIADANIRLGHLEEAETALLNIIRSHPENVQAHSMLGSIYMSTQRLIDATDKFCKALDYDQSKASMWADLGHVLSRQKMYEEALKAFQRALCLEPDNWDYGYNVGDSLLALGQPEKALVFLNKAAQLNPDYSPAHYDLGLAFFELGRYEDCAISSMKTLSPDPNMESQRSNLGIGATTNLGLAYMNLGEYGEAEECFRRNLKLMSSNYFNLGLTLFRQKRFDDALINFKSALQSKPDDPEYLDLIGNTHLELGQFDDALNALECAIAADGGYALAHYDKGVVLSRTKGEEAAAIKSLKRAIKLDAGLYWAYYSIGCIYAVKGEKKLALQYLNLALRKGFRDFPHLEKDNDWDCLKNDIEFKNLMCKYS
jgi:tetratricopeptide (TPR) repeat protein